MFVLIFSLDGKNFCQFMTPIVFKPRFWAQFHPGLLGALAFHFPKTDLGALGPFRGPPGFTFVPLGPLRTHLVLHLGPWGPLGGRAGRPKADIMEAEGRLNRGLGAEPPGMQKSKKQKSVRSGPSCAIGPQRRYTCRSCLLYTSPSPRDRG